jgi:ABC-type dipeptide/oligopeptide/nickel transport system permease subunit
LNTVNPLIVQASLSIAFAILAEASFSFLGLGDRIRDLRDPPLRLV